MESSGRGDAGGDRLGRTTGQRLWSAAKLVAVIVGLLWAVEIVDQVALDDRLQAWGIRPRTLSGLWGILTAPFLHGDFAHLIANTPPLVVLALLLLVLRGVGAFLGLTAAVAVGSGLGVWLTGAASSNHIGASGVIFGWLGFLLLAGLVERRLSSLLTSIVVAVLYGGLVWGVLPSDPRVSWQGHLFGFLAGLATAWLARRPRRAAGTPGVG
jgi:membrane associated rhomboid family serine protease